MLLKKNEAHEIRVLGWNLGRTRLTGDRGFSLEQGSIFIVWCKQNNKIQLPDPYQRSSFVFQSKGILRSFPTKGILLEAL